MNRFDSKVVSLALLIAGSALGAGLLGLPILTGLAGAVPSAALTVLLWLMMVGVGLILVDQTLDSGLTRGDLGPIYRARLGRWGEAAAGVIYLILFHGLLTAYLSGAGEVLSQLTSTAQARPYLTVGFFIVGAGLVLFGLDLVRRCNAWMMGLLILSFGLLVAASLAGFRPARLAEADWLFAPGAAPIILCAFGYQNLIPLVCRTLDQDRRRISRAIVLGTGLVLAINLIWIVLIIGALPLKGPGGGNILAAFNHNQPATIPLAVALDSKLIVFSGLVFSVLAMLTSYVAVGSALISFTGDLLRAAGLSGRPGLARLLTLGPSLVATWLFPHLFLSLLNLVGGGCLIVLFGIMPCLMALRSGRARDQNPWRGRGLAGLLLALFVIILGLEIMQEIGWLSIPPLADHWVFHLPGRS